MAFITPVFQLARRNTRRGCSTIVCSQARAQQTVARTAAAITLATVASVFIHAHHVEAISMPSLPSLPSLPPVPMPDFSSSDSSSDKPVVGDKFSEEQEDKVEDMMAKLEAKKKARAAKM